MIERGIPASGMPAWGKRMRAGLRHLAWVASESEIHATKDAKMLIIASTETMVLRRSEAGWMIMYSHWSSRAATSGHEGTASRRRPA